jgi:hypothetical protein
LVIIDRLRVFADAAHAWQMPIAMLAMPLGLGLFHAYAGPLACFVAS